MASVRLTQMRMNYFLITIAAIGICTLLYIQGELGLKGIGTSVLALFGTFLGATLAFRLNEQKEEAETARKKREALNRALFVLIRQHNAIIQLKRDMDACPNDFHLAFNMPALKPPSYADLFQHVADLEFLIDSGNPNILFKLTIEQERFHQAIDSIRIRNEFYVNEVQPQLAATGMNGKRVTLEDAEALLGERIFGGAMNGAIHAKKHLNDSNDSIPKVLEELRTEAKELFPGHKFLDYQNSNN